MADAASGQSLESGRRTFSVMHAGHQMDTALTLGVGWRVDSNERGWIGTETRRLDVLQEVRRRSGWRRGLLVGGLAGVAAGVVVHAIVDGMPCDSCTEGRSAAEGARLEFAIAFGLLGAGLGALLGR